MMTPDDTAAAPDQTSGPTDIRDGLVRSEAKRAAVWLGMASLIALAVYLAQPLIVIFGGIVFAAMIDGGQRLLARALPARLQLPRGVRIAIVLLAAVAFVVWLVMFAGNQIAAQATELPRLIATQAQRLGDLARAHGLLPKIIDMSGLETRIAGELAGGVGPLTRALGGLFGGFTTFFLIIVLGIYFAVEPDLYQRGLAWLLPTQTRNDWHGITHDMGRALRRLLFGRLIGMASEGAATWLLLSAWGVPMAALLGLLTGLLAFLPNIGAPISGGLMIMVGFSAGVNTGIYCIVVYAVVQIVDGNIVVPMVAKKTADLAPALVLGAQLIFGVLFGLLGLVLADPLVAMVKIALQRQASRNDSDRVDDAADAAGSGSPR
ncbi:AI-2E family transporter [Novosphingobium sp.]|uniref:AI-2E family transporter n=1 Tax=Novosphingobium sp. TaxID=1874826 RepID=UPI00333E5E08